MTPLQESRHLRNSRDDIVWDQRFEAVSAFVTEKFNDLRTEEVCKIMQDWISVHYAQHDSWKYIQWCLQEAYEEFHIQLGSDVIADYLRAAVQPFVETKPDPKLLMAVIEALLNPSELDED